MDRVITHKHLVRLLTWMNALVIHFVDDGCVLDKTDDLSGGDSLNDTVILANLDLGTSGIGGEPLPRECYPGASHNRPTEGVNVGDTELDINGGNIIGAGN